MAGSGGFTATSVNDLLHNGVLDPDGGNRVGAASPACSHLARLLNRMQQVVAGWQGPWQESATNLQKIADAIDTLTTLLPPLRVEYAAEVEIGEADRWNLPENESFLALSKRRLAAFDALTAAAVVAREEELPIAALNVAFTRPVTQRTDIAERLEQIFHDALPGASKADGYRFVVAVTPHLTGETPSFAAVQKHLKRTGKVNGDMPPA